MTLAALVTGLVLVPLDHDLRAAKIVEHLSGDLNLCKLRGIGGDLIAVHEKEGGQIELAVGVTGHPIDGQDRTDLDLLLPAACAHYCVNQLSTFSSRTFFRVPGEAGSCRGERA